MRNDIKIQVIKDILRDCFNDIPLTEEVMDVKRRIKKKLNNSIRDKKSDEWI